MKWYPIKGFENYLINKNGEIFSKYRNKKIKPWIKSSKKKGRGYLRVALRKNNKAYYIMIHRLLLKTFIREPNAGETCNHKDGNKLNNKLNNLEWITLKDNIQHAFKMGLYDTPKMRAYHMRSRKFSEEETKQLKEIYKKEKITFVELAKKLKTNPTVIRRTILRT